MGWTCSYKPPGTSLEKYFIEKGVLNWGEHLPHRYKVLDSALVRLSVFYAALEVTDKASGERYVTALVILVKMFPRDKDGFSCCWKDLEENMGPYETDCPERILNLLTPTDNENAIEWREACWQKIRQRTLVPPLRKGVALAFDKPVVFTNGERSRLTVLSSKGQAVICTDENRFLYKLKRNWITDMAAAGELHFV